MFRVCVDVSCRGFFLSVSIIHGRSCLRVCVQVARAAPSYKPLACTVLASVLPRYVCLCVLQTLDMCMRLIPCVCIRVCSQWSSYFSCTYSAVHSCKDKYCVCTFFSFTNFLLPGKQLLSLNACLMYCNFKTLRLSLRPRLPELHLRTHAPCLHRASKCAASFIRARINIVSAHFSPSPIFCYQVFSPG